ncbi:PTS sugar transporter subunit IIA [Breznakia pachnodae]|uniref:Glucose-specific phosphotransferase system IIA component n=1 Tax=Breznakia pachnodae TaxID=265178 RepID=A0ABU0E169_9FIRM|nr:PTS glucose transporter subunit IIA [Breznakia pachnodae]MDQ0360471.1 glucose-specific phosphotransferase system IIA component [Breznakia pachnodae]
MLKMFNKKECILYSPINGEVIEIETVADKVFSSKMMGEGVGFILNEEFICAPCDGEISVIPSTLHAFGITAKNGAEILVHVGLDTVNLQGEGFKKLVNQGDLVKKGTPVLKVDLELMKRKKIDLTTPMVITNSSDFNIIINDLNKSITKEFRIMSCIKK